MKVTEIDSFLTSVLPERSRSFHCSHGSRRFYSVARYQVVVFERPHAAVKNFSENPLVTVHDKLQLRLSLQGSFTLEACAVQVDHPAIAHQWTASLYARTYYTRLSGYTDRVPIHEPISQLPRRTQSKLWVCHNQCSSYLVHSAQSSSSPSRHSLALATQSSRHLRSYENMTKALA
ncbi:hypothetical protein CC80DRAFT_313946 [Byssothecium circinans]|uniref:Uncharacterized protein n=1 Tax=Byssothecium circinans TaxID=147558 RepID=A0A6A5U6K7_9PLEO|nr:hypothetical protein CC80DRAFT_313946 [Byssothecium circinans]